MNWRKILIAPIISAWFAGSLWWMSRSPDCGCGTRSSITSVAVAPFIAASASPVSPNVTVADQPGTTFTAALGGASSNDAATFPGPRTIPFVKNVVGSAWDNEQTSYFLHLRDHLLTHPGASITITGHSDADGDATANVRLSLLRAEQVKEALAKMGAPAAAIHTIGMGAEQPIADNITSKGKAQNRRVVITLDPPSTSKL